METVSVIVPVYNVKRYLPRCIESILRQSHTELEIILVDDGSTDGSGAVCDRYAARDERIKVVHKRNEGVSAARNTGLELSTGQYIAFVDSDDWLALTAIETLYRRITEDRADFAVGDLENVDSIRRSKPTASDPRGVFHLDDPEDFSRFFMAKISLAGPVAKLFRADIIHRHHLIFPLGFKIGEDTIFVLRYLNQIKIASHEDRVVYFYNRLVEESATLRYSADYCNTIIETISLEYESVKKLRIEDSDAAWSFMILKWLKFLIKYYASFGIDYCTFAPIFRYTLDTLQSRNPGMFAAMHADDDNAELLRCIATGDCEALYHERQKSNSGSGNRNGIIEAIKRPLREVKKHLLFDLRLGL